MSSTVGPKAHANAWPAALKEFSDLLHEEAIKSARDAYAAGFRRPTAEDISMSDEALAWPLRYAAHEPMACDAVLLWALCKAGGFSIAALLRERTVKAKAKAERMAEEEMHMAKKPLLKEAAELLVRARSSDPGMSGDPAIAVRAAEVRASLKAIRKPIVLPWQVMPEKVLSRTTLDRYLPAGLAYLAEQLHEARVPVR